MKECFYFCFIMIFTVSVNYCQEHLSVLLKQEIELLNPIPRNNEDFLQKVTSSGELVTESIPIENLENKLKSQYNLQTEVINKLKGIAYAESVAYQGFKFVLDKGAFTEQFVGALRNVNGLIKLTFIQVKSHGFAARWRQQDKIGFPLCLTIPNCKDLVENISHVWNFTPAELLEIKQTLMYHGYQYLLNKFNEQEIQNRLNSLNELAFLDY